MVRDAMTGKEEDATFIKGTTTLALSVCLAQGTYMVVYKNRGGGQNEPSEAHGECWCRIFQDLQIE